MKPETLCLHAGYHPKNAEPRVVPIVQSTTYVYDSTEEVASVFDEPTKSLIYSRFANPTVMAVEDKIAELEGGVGALCTSSGQAANMLAVLNIMGAGDDFLCAREVYGGTVNLFDVTLRKLGISVSFFDSDMSDEQIEAMIGPKTRAIFGETITNPTISVFDIERFASFEGNTGPYILYTIVRIKSILKKYAENGGNAEGAKILAAENAAEKALMLQVLKFNEVIDTVYAETAPHKLCAYIYDLANEFNKFYHETKILSEEDEAKKSGYIALLNLAKKVLETCIDLLGFTAPERM